MLAHLVLRCCSGFSPLTGFLNKEDYESVVENMRLKVCVACSSDRHVCTPCAVNVGSAPGHMSTHIACTIMQLHCGIMLHSSVQARTQYALCTIIMFER